MKGLIKKCINEEKKIDYESMRNVGKLMAQNKFPDDKQYCHYLYGYILSVADTMSKFKETMTQLGNETTSKGMIEILEKLTSNTKRD